MAAVAGLLAADARRAGIDPAGPQAEAMVEMLIAALRGGAEWGLARPDVPREQIVDAALDLLWTGLGNPALAAVGRGRRAGGPPAARAIEQLCPVE